MNEQGKTCINCKCFKMYYVLSVSWRFTPIGKGYCVCPNKRKQEVEQGDTCNKWQSNEQQKLKDYYIAEVVLQDISAKLEAIRNILSNGTK